MLTLSLALAETSRSLTEAQQELDRAAAAESSAQSERSSLEGKVQRMTEQLRQAQRVTTL